MNLCVDSKLERIGCRWHMSRGVNKLFTIMQPIAYWTYEEMRRLNQWVSSKLMAYKREYLLWKFQCKENHRRREKQSAMKRQPSKLLSNWNRQVFICEIFKNRIDFSRINECIIWAVGSFKWHISFAFDTNWLDGKLRSNATPLRSPRITKCFVQFDGSIQANGALKI